MEATKLDKKQQVLVAIFTEYQKDLPEMNVINHESLGMKHEEFVVAIQKLENEGFITGVKAIKADQPIIPVRIIMNRVMMTPYGIQYVESTLKIDMTLTGLEKVQEIFGRAAEWGFEQLKDIAAKTLAEMTKG